MLRIKNSDPTKAVLVFLKKKNQKPNQRNQNMPPTKKKKKRVQLKTNPKTFS